MVIDGSEAIARSISRLLAGPLYPEREYVHSGATFADVYAMAAWLRERLAAPKYHKRPVCLATDSKAVIAAALLASLAGGPALLLPYACSDKVLVRMRQTTGFTTAIAEAGRAFPAGVEVLWPEAAGTRNIPVDPNMSPKDELLRIFTGGSTGAPQVWRKTCGNIIGEFFFLAESHGVTERDCIMATIPACHIYGLLFSIGLPLVSAATVIDETPSYPREIVRLAQEREATILVSVPAHYRVLREEKLRSSPRLAFSSAGMLDPVDNECFHRHNHVGVVEVYGSTETGGIATRNRFLGEEHFTPFATVDWKIVDERLAVRSPYISPDLAVDGEGFYLAGDRVERVAERRFALKGRADSVTKVGGKRVDLEEIRLFIKKTPGVEDCAVLALPEAGGREHQIAVLIQGGAVDIEALRKTLADSLESYALPRRIRTVERIPMTASGKYDRAAIAGLLQR